ncbi:MAG: hypothetical protein ACFFCW_26880 [Candidatus Hodarchaeota archaeon]
MVLQGQNCKIGLSIWSEVLHHILPRDTGRSIKRSSTLKTKPLAEQIGKLIVKRQDDKKLKWSDDKTDVRVIIGEIIPDDTAKETVAGRRKRFRRDLTQYFLISHNSFFIFLADG